MNKEEATKEKRGGKREGAGRKKTLNLSRTTGFRIEADLWEAIKDMDNRSRFINDAIREKLKTKDK